MVMLELSEALYIINQDLAYVRSILDASMLSCVIFIYCQL